jgi:hypothetical protein
MDHALASMTNLPVTIACLGLLYCETDGIVGQMGDKLNLVDLAMLPLTPIMGDGQAPLQPQEICDAAGNINTSAARIDRCVDRYMQSE